MFLPPWICPPALGVAFNGDALGAKGLSPRYSPGWRQQAFYLDGVADGSLAYAMLFGDFLGNSFHNRVFQVAILPTRFARTARQTR